MNITIIASNQKYKEAHAGFTHPYNLAKAFSRLGHKVLMIFKTTKGFPNDFVDDGIHIHLADWSARITNLPKFIGNFINEYKYIKNRKKEIDIIYERYELTRFSTGIIARLLKIPCALEINTPVLDVRFNHKKIRKKILGIIDKFHLSRFNCVITQTESLKNIIGQRYKKTIHVVPNGVDFEFFSKTSKELQATLKQKLGLKDKKIIGYLGAMMPWHGVHDLLNAFRIVVQSNGNSALLIIGGDKEDLLVIDKDTLDLIQTGNIIAVGKLEYNQVPQYLNICDVLVAPFNTKLDTERKELYAKYGMWWCPIKLFEYLATGKPIVAPKLIEIEKYLNKLIYYYDEGDISGLSKAITQATKEGSESKFQQQRINLIKNRYTWEIQAKKILNILKESAIGRKL